jgi:zinc transport system ATP-binding protein
MPPEVAIRVAGLSVTRGDTRILEDVSLEVPAGRFLGVLGPNGGGKSTLLRVLVGLDAADAGKVEVLGLPPGRSRDVGYLPQAAVYDLRMPIRVREAVALGLSRRPRRQDQRRIEDVLEQMQLTSIAGKPVGVLSGGERQRMFLARALIREPRLLLLDEPTLGVDARSLDAFLHLLVRLREERGLTILMVSHDFSVVSSHADAVLCLARTVQFHGSGGDLTEAHLLATFGLHNLYLEHRH